MSAHTPGPWHVEPEKDGTCVMAGDYYITDTIDAAGGDSDDTTQHANARLIAAAPDLLDACLTLLAWDEAENNAEAFDKDQGKAWRERQALCAASFDKARAAIQKATGGQS